MCVPLNVPIRINWKEAEKVESHCAFRLKGESMTLDAITIRKKCDESSYFSHVNRASAIVFIQKD